MGWWCSCAVVVSYYYAISPPPWFRQFSALNLCSCTSLAAAAAHNAFQCPSKASILHLVGLQRLHLVELVVDQPFHCLPFLSSWAGFTVTNDRLDPAILLIPWNTIYIQVCSSTAVKSTWQHRTKSISLSAGPDPCPDTWLRGQWANQMISVQIGHRPVPFKTKWMSRPQTPPFYPTY